MCDIMLRVAQSTTHWKARLDQSGADVVSAYLERQGIPPKHAPRFTLYWEERNRFVGGDRPLAEIVTEELGPDHREQQRRKRAGRVEGAMPRVLPPGAVPDLPTMALTMFVYPTMEELPTLPSGLRELAFQQARVAVVKEHWPVKDWNAKVSLAARFLAYLCNAQPSLNTDVGFEHQAAEIIPYSLHESLKRTTKQAQELRQKFKEELRREYAIVIGELYGQLKVREDFAGNVSGNVSGSASGGTPMGVLVETPIDVVDVREECTREEVGGEAKGAMGAKGAKATGGADGAEVSGVIEMAEMARDSDVPSNPDNPDNPGKPDNLEGQSHAGSSLGSADTPETFIDPTDTKNCAEPLPTAPSDASPALLPQDSENAVFSEGTADIGTREEANEEINEGSNENSNEDSNKDSNTEVKKILDDASTGSPTEPLKELPTQACTCPPADTQQTPTKPGSEPLQPPSESGSDAPDEDQARHDALVLRSLVFLSKSVRCYGDVIFDAEDARTREKLTLGLSPRGLTVYHETSAGDITYPMEHMIIDRQSSQKGPTYVVVHESQPKAIDRKFYVLLKDRFIAFFNKMKEQTCKGQ